MSEPIDLSSERDKRREDQLQSTECAKCGGVWMDASIVLGVDGTMTAIHWPVICHACGAELEKTR